MSSFYYKSLGSAQKVTYDTVLNGLKAMQQSIPIKSSNGIAELVENMTYDYPELFYIDKKFNVTSGLRRTDLNPKYIYNKSQVAAFRRQLESVTNEITEELINEHQSEYDKALVLHDYLKKNIQYDYPALESMSRNGKGFEDSYTVVGALVKQKCVCAGFSLAMKMLCDKIGLECHIVSGIGNSSIYHGSHAWNLVRINGYYHHVDVTWDNQFSDDMNIPNYGYFGLDDETISKDHTWNRKIYPACPDSPYNYFKINQSLMDSQVQLQKYIYEHMLNEESLIMFKIQKGRPLEAEISGCLEKLIMSASSKCKHSRMEQYSIQWIPEQLVYMLNIEYR